MYEVRPEIAKTFITDRSIILPRFQRKQTWDEKKNFLLCISVFKGYPMGVCIINTEKEAGKTKRILLDGRQRRNALIQMYENPEVIGIWAKKYLGFKQSIDQYELSDLFYDKINTYLEEDEEDANDVVDVSDDEQEDVYDDSDDELTNMTNLEGGNGGLKLLLDVIVLTYKKTKHATGFTAPFDFTKLMKQLPYIDQDETNDYIVNGKKVKSFIAEYRNDCDNNDLDYEGNSDYFADYLLHRAVCKDKVSEVKVKLTVKNNWDDIIARFDIVDKLDDIMSQCKIGLIEVSGFKPADAQKIFNIINSEGVKLTAVEILSAKTYWNKKILNPTGDMLGYARELYSNMGIRINDVYRWDIPATLLARLGDNVIFKSLSWDSINKKAEFEKKLTLGFKLMSGIFEKGIKKEDIDDMGKNTEIDWDVQSEQIITSIKNVIKLIEEVSYFKFLKSWRTSIMELTSDAIALDFLLILYFDWKRKECPIGSSTKTRQFQKNCFILWDQLIYEYVRKQWRGSSDSLIASNIKALDSMPDVFEPVTREKWIALLNEILEKNTVNDANVSISLMKPILYHMYCISNIAGPGLECTIDVDHIIPQSCFKASTIPGKEVIQDNLYNLGLLPKRDNISKSNKKLNQILGEDSWLISQIEKYEFITVDRFEEFSAIGNYKKLFEFKKKKYDDVFGTEGGAFSLRDTILFN